MNMASRTIPFLNPFGSDSVLLLLFRCYYYCFVVIIAFSLLSLLLFGCVSSLSLFRVDFVGFVYPLRVYNLGFMAWGLRFRVSGFDFRVSGLRSRVWGLGVPSLRGRPAIVVMSSSCLREYRGWPLPSKDETRYVDPSLQQAMLTGSVCLLALNRTEVPRS